MRITLHRPASDVGRHQPLVAWAADGDNIPAAANPKMWQKYVASVNKQNAAQDWSTVRDLDRRLRIPALRGWLQFLQHRRSRPRQSSSFRITTAHDHFNAAGMRSLMGKEGVFLRATPRDRAR